MKEPVIRVPADCHEVLLHVCCAPCSSAIVEWLTANGVRPTIFYYNPNIWPREEYEIRKQESKRHAEGLGIRWIDGDYDHEQWRGDVCGLENQPERGLRCELCFTLRLKATALKARELDIRHFATTLASSRWKSLEQINRAGQAAEVAGTTFWPQNWRKGGLQERRNQLLREYGFYNQQYCGCEFSAHNVPTKEVLRQQMRAAKAQHRELLPRMSADIVERLKKRIADRQVVMGYWPLPDEVDIRGLLDSLVAEGRTVVLPKVLDDEQMELRRYTSRDDLAEGAFHILEPIGKPFTDYGEIDVALIPGVAFDAAGHRLGRGRGYYDRFLTSHLSPPTSHHSPLTTHLSPLTTHHSPRLIGVCFPFQRVAKVPAEEHDVVMDETV